MNIGGFLPTNSEPIYKILLNLTYMSMGVRLYTKLRNRAVCKWVNYTARCEAIYKTAKPRDVQNRLTTLQDDRLVVNLMFKLDLQCLTVCDVESVTKRDGHVVVRVPIGSSNRWPEKIMARDRGDRCVRRVRVSDHPPGCYTGRTYQVVRNAIVVEQG